MASKKRVAVQLGEFNRVIEFDCTHTGVSERETLLLKVRAVYSDRIKPTDCLTLQIQSKDQDWHGMFFDFVDDGVDDRSIFRVLVEKAEVRLCNHFQPVYMYARCERFPCCLYAG